MRSVDVSIVTKNIKEMCIQANHFLSEDMDIAMKNAVETEKAPLGKQILTQLQENLKIAGEDMIPICQDTGMAVVFIEVGQEVHFEGGSLTDAINEGVRQGYVEGYLRKSSVAEPLFERKNTGDNTPAVLHVRLVPGDRIRLKLAPKGAGSENKSALKMLVPADGIEGVKKFVVDTVKAAGSSPCPPMVVGVGIGGTLELAGLCAKRAAMRDVDTRNPDPRYAAFEEELLGLLNDLGTGPQGLGGTTTAFKVNVEFCATHIASLPVAVNINCHAARHAEAEL